jgi:hypothetical protein
VQDGRLANDDHNDEDDEDYEFRRALEMSREEYQKVGVLHLIYFFPMEDVTLSSELTYIDMFDLPCLGRAGWSLGQ